MLIVIGRRKRRNATRSNSNSSMRYPTAAIPQENRSSTSVACTWRDSAAARGMVTRRGLDRVKTPRYQSTLVSGSNGNGALPIDEGGQREQSSRHRHQDTECRQNRSSPTAAGNGRSMNIARKPWSRTKTTRRRHRGDQGVILGEQQGGIEICSYKSCGTKRDCCCSQTHRLRWQSGDAEETGRMKHIGLEMLTHARTADDANVEHPAGVNTRQRRRLHGVRFIPRQGAEVWTRSELGR